LEVDKVEGTQKHLFIAATSDRGLCGAANSSIIKYLLLEINPVLVLLEHMHQIYFYQSMKLGNDQLFLVMHQLLPNN
jgi:hypothetical protein